eukprot:GHVR01013271.1.p1 GENE.GHVR01013271.1~~GHVR01013271.1.p1  ORF type:complete len:168 (+),score=40.09 GHVR01013271.1:978-1481(+)
MSESIKQISMCGYVHRDIKAENFVMLEDDSVKLLDFGCLMPVNTQSKDVCGSKRYQSPESRKIGVVGTAADVYSLGVLLYDIYNQEASDKIFVELENIEYDNTWNNKQYNLFEKDIEQFKVLAVDDNETNINARKLVLLMLSVDPMRRPLIQEVIDKLTTWLDGIMW